MLFCSQNGMFQFFSQSQRRPRNSLRSWRKCFRACESFGREAVLLAA